MPNASPVHVVLVPGFFGFSALGELAYFGHVLRFLASWLGDMLAPRPLQLHVVETEPTATLTQRAARVLDVLAAKTNGDDGPIHLVGHSSGGLDIRLLLLPGVSLPTPVDAEPFCTRVRTAISISTPHHGTPVAAFFTSVVGQRLLQLLALATAYLIRFGHVPLSVMVRLGALLIGLKQQVGITSVFLDPLFDQLLADFAGDGRRAIQQMLGRIGSDQSLMLQLAPEAMELFNSGTRERPGVRYASVVSCAPPPGLRSAARIGLDPGAQASHAVYAALHRLAGSHPHDRLARLTAEQGHRLRSAFGRELRPSDNDGVVPALSQVFGEVLHAATADHLDVIGFFRAPAARPPHYDWLVTGSGFTRNGFEALWSRVADFVAEQS